MSLLPGSFPSPGLWLPCALSWLIFLLDVLSWEDVFPSLCVLPLFWKCPRLIYRYTYSSELQIHHFPRSLWILQGLFGSAVLTSFWLFYRDKYIIVSQELEVSQDREEPDTPNVSITWIQWLFFLSRSLFNIIIFVGRRPYHSDT